MLTATLNPSDFAFLYENCKRCFYLTKTMDIRQPSKPMAAIFNKIDQQEKAAFADVVLSTLAPGLPNGRIMVTETDWTESTYVNYPELDYRHFIRGKFDSLMKMPDDSIQIIDFKTSDTKQHSSLYAKQLHAYAYSLENPMYEYQRIVDKGQISGIGLIIFDPDKGFEVTKDGTGMLRGTFSWKPLQYTPDKFVEFMGKLASTLSGEMPDFNPDCPYCKRDLLMMDWKNQVTMKDTEEKKEEEGDF